MLLEVRRENSLITVLTAPSTSELPSFVFVCPSNCGSCTLTESTAVSPSRTSSPVDVEVVLLEPVALVRVQVDHARERAT